MSKLIGKRLKKRLSNHICILSLIFIFLAIIYATLLNFYPDAERLTFRLSLTTAYISVILLAVTLTYGVWNIFRHHVNPVSSDLRRDIGIWCAVFCLIHTLLGFNIHLKYWTQYFIDNSGNFLTDLFGVANYLGVLAILIVIMLLLTSNDFSLRILGRNRWKAFQRWNYVFAMLAILHGFAYQVVEKRIIPFSFVFGVVGLWMAFLQLAGFLMSRRLDNALPDR